MNTYQTKQDRLRAAVAQAEYSYGLAQAAARRLGRTAPVRHKCFISYHGADIDEVTAFIEEFSDVFIPRVVGVSDSDHFQEPVNSTDEDYIKDQIGSKYLTQSSVTIVFVGSCTWSRKYVDWEIASTVRNGTKNKRAGLMGITPASRAKNKLPARFESNVDSGYAKYYWYPKTAEELRESIEDAYQARVARASKVVGGPLMKKDKSC